jgi:molybdopterin/thiamine biosynthesis adenylyltransferase
LSSLSLIKPGKESLLVEQPVALPVARSLALPAVSPEQVDRMLYCADRAPSPHNAQGWTVTWSAARFEVRLDPARQVLRELDPLHREGELACGAVVANLELAAAGLGLCTGTRWRPDAADATLLATVDTSPGGQIDEAALCVISRRAVNRAPYRTSPLATETLRALEAEAALAGCTLHLVTARAAIDQVAALAARAGKLKLSHRATAHELYSLLRLDAGSAAATRDGLDVRLFDPPPGGAAASAVLFHPLLQEVIDLAGQLAHRSEELPIRSSPCVALLCAAEDGPQAFLQGGRAFQRVALEVTRRGLALQPHSAPIEVGLAGLGAGLPAGQVSAIDLGLRRAFGCTAQERPIALFRIGEPLRAPSRKSLRRTQPAASTGGEDHYRELTRRNQPALPAQDQAKLSKLRVLFAGCGSIGGAPVEPLARMGLTHFVLAEPGAYELNNLNRQAALLGDLGRNKAEVLRDLVANINPSATALVAPHGVTPENVDWLVGSTDVIIDGVDVTEEAGLAAKRLLHEEAFRQQRVVICGLDLAGTQLVRIFDYRKPGARPFDGRLDRAPARLTPLEFLARIIDPLDFPIEMLDYCEASIRGQAGSAPQLAPAADLFGVLAAWAVLDLACGRPLVDRVRLDVPDLLRPRPARLITQAVRLARLCKLRLLLEVARAGLPL